MLNELTKFAKNLMQMSFQPSSTDSTHGDLSTDCRR